MGQTKVQQNQLDPNLQFGGGSGGGPSIFEVGVISPGSPAIYDATLVDVSQPVELGSPTTSTRVLVFVNGVNQVQESDFNYDYQINRITFSGGSPTSIPLPGDQIVLMTIGGTSGGVGSPSGPAVDGTFVRMDLGSPVTRTNEGTLRISGSPVTLHTDFYQDTDLNIIGTGAISLGYSGLERLRTAADGRARVLGDTSTGSGRILLEFVYQNGVSVRGMVGYDNSGILRLRNQIHGQGIILDGENNSGVDKQFFIADPDARTEIRGRTDIELFVGESSSLGNTALIATEEAGIDFYYMGSPTGIVARTVSEATGGLEVNNTVTGGGFERVLTTSDLGSSAFIGAKSTSATGSQSTTSLMVSITWTADDYDLPGSPQIFNAASSSTDFVVPVTGKYVVSGSLFFNSGGDNTGTYVALRLLVGGGAELDVVEAYDMSVIGLPTFGMGLSGSTGPLQLSAGTIIEMQMASDEGGGGLGLSTTNRTSLSIHKVD